MRTWAAIVLFGTGAVSQEVAPVRPNLVVIVADDLGYGDLGCFGAESIRTPHLDRLAREGLRFTDFHTNGAVCSPTRAALWTGRYQQRAGIEGVVTAARHRDTGLALGETTVAEVLRGAGYRTALFGKWHLGYAPRFGPVRQGFEEFQGFVSGNVDYHAHIDQEGHFDWWRGAELEDDAGHATDLIGGYGERFIEERGDEPFLLVLAHGAPHYPYQHRESSPFREVGHKRVQVATEDRAGVYARMIAEMDEGIGRIVAALEGRGIAERTLVFFMSDNGPARGAGSAGSLRGHKGQVWEGGHRVPAIAWWPGTIRAGTSDELVVGMDLFPTMATLAQAAVGEDLALDGVDLGPHLLRGEPVEERTVFWKLRGDGARAVRRGHHKLVVLRPGTDREAVQLFDLDEDPAESVDIAGEQDELVRELRAVLAAWVAEVGRVPRRA